MPRFLHTADWQIGRQYGRFAPDDALALAEARFAAVERLAQLATQHAVDAVLVAGDVFDAQTVSDRTIRRLLLALEGFGGPWLLLPGNHDAALAESVWERARRLRAVPGHVHILDAPGVHRFDAAGFAVLAAPLTQRQTAQDLTEPFDMLETPAGLLRIGLAHGSVRGLLAEGIDAPNPIAAERAGRARLDYLALGDWHGTRQVDERTWYAGTPEPDRFRNNEAGQALLVELAGPGRPPTVTPMMVGRHVWHEWTVQLRVATDLDELLARLRALPAPAVLSLEVEGQSDLDGRRRLADALAEAEARHRSVQAHLDGLRLLPTDAELAALRADGYLGEVIAELRERQDAPEGGAARDALAILAGLLADEASGPREL
ncbi:MAG: exonuclease SbcCD subunit D [Pigmentiphaga sp.]